ncbi:uncharacterized protein BDR25DRAFT_83267 [Lindgomyces ingoldianus]|uniref:Uncharacterized protein n=1 Tax=Lindgomyces ingoldianus TaxID=673940 RepID=A0ACB6QG11_9PLEO|nr:uncharacterized protein BDR25DRAFT_83267 [Lindgomyces ingoldianus]KAF2465827.1 hypothetical protein BDR25DRAFT_83267 [Lindgomyces ingoldianus]
MRRTPTLNDCNIFESSFVLRRAELNNRKLTEGQSPWSIRQTAVYHRRIPIVFTEHDSESGHNALRYRSVFLLISPSESFEKQLALCADSFARELAMSWQNIVRLLVSDAAKGWREYMAWMEEEIMEQSNRLVFAKVDSERDSFDPLTDYQISFIDRQRLKQLEDKVNDLGIILSTMQQNVLGICDYTRKIGQEEYHADGNVVDAIIEELEEQAKEIEMHVKRGEALKARLNSVTELLSDLLNYEDAIALKAIGREAQVENQSMHKLAEKSTNDAAAVKVLTVIGLVYLPVTVVTGFFSTQFVNTTDGQSMQVSRSAWLLAAISIPLTVLTIATWWSWVHLHLRVPPKLSLPGCSIRRVDFRDRLQSIRLQLGRRAFPDLESGSNLRSSEGCAPSPPPSCKLYSRSCSEGTEATKVG